MGANAELPKEPSSMARILQLLIPGQLARKLNTGVAEKMKAVTPKKEEK